MFIFDELEVILRRSIQFIKDSHSFFSSSYCVKCARDPEAMFMAMMILARSFLLFHAWPIAEKSKSY